MVLNKFTIKEKRKIFMEISSKEKELLEIKKFKERTKTTKKISLKKVKLKAPELKLR